MDEITRKLMYPKNRREYTEAFLEVYKQEKWKNHLVEQFGEKYYQKVMEIHQERLDKNDFNIGPQSPEDWDKFKEQLNN